MRTQIAATALLALLCGGCAVDRGDGRVHHQQATPDTVEPARETFALGSTITAEGIVPLEAASEAFTRGREVFLSIDVTGSSTDQRIAVEWVDPSGHVIRRESRDVPEGSRYAAFSSGRGVASTPGMHRAVVIINGRKVIEKPFSIL